MRSARRSTGASTIMPLPLSVCFSDTLMRRPLAGDLGLLGGHRRGQLRDSRADVLREVLKVAALFRILLLAQPFPQRHDLSSVT
jgi:hypothetical protein